MFIVNSSRLVTVAPYTAYVPKLWVNTIEGHRREVRDATLNATADLVAKHGPFSVTMSQIAEETGIGRATLYKYFPDVEAILVAWHERRSNAHLQQLTEIRDQAGDAGQRLEAVLDAYARISHEHHGSELAAFLHRGAHDHRDAHVHRRAHVARAHQQLKKFISDLLAEAAKAGDVRADIPADELAGFCIQALDGASNLTSAASARRLLTVTLAGLRPPG